MQEDSPVEAFRRLDTISCGAVPAARVDRTRERIQQSLRVRCERGCRRMCCVQIVKEPGRMAPRKQPRRSLRPVLPHGGKAAFAARFYAHSWRRKKSRATLRTLFGFFRTAGAILTSSSLCHYSQRNKRVEGAGGQLRARIHDNKTSVRIDSPEVSMRRQRTQLGTL